MGNRIIQVGQSSSQSAYVDYSMNQSYVYKDISMTAMLKSSVNTISAYNDIAHALAKDSTLEKILDATDETLLLYMQSSQSLSKKAFDYVSKLRKLSYADLSAQLDVIGAGLDGNSISVYRA